MNIKKDFMVVLLLLTSVIILGLNLRYKTSQKLLKNNLEIIHEGYTNLIRQNEQQVLYNLFTLNKNFIRYDPYLKDCYFNSIKLTEVIDSIALVYRFTNASCSSCEEEKIEYFLANMNSLKYQFIVLCNNELLFSKLCRIYKYNNLKVYQTVDDVLNSSKFESEFSSMYFFIDRSGTILTNILPENIEMYYDIL